MQNQIFYQQWSSPCGPMCIASLNDLLIMSDWIDGWHRQTIMKRFDRMLRPQWIEKETPIILKAIKELKEYFAKERRSFDLPIHLVGSEFQVKTWLALRKIPYGESRTYGDIAQEIGQSGANRAVGGAVGQNPLSIIIPCHRVLGSRSTLTGYGGGMATKKELLRIEGIFNSLSDTTQS